MGAVQFIENLDRTVLTVSDEEFEKSVEVAVSEIAEKHKEEQTCPGPISEKPGSGQVPEHPNITMEVQKYHRRKSADVLNPSSAGQENIAVAGLLRTIQRPLSSIGRIFSEDTGSGKSPGKRAERISSHPPETPRRLSPAVFQPPQKGSEDGYPLDESRAARQLNMENAASRQASAEAAEAHRIQQAEHEDVVE
jgi:hypothetical protein